MQAFAHGLLELGDTVVIGGLVRDLLLLSNNEKFSSDIDFVVHPESVDEFERSMEGTGASRNRFGGYSLDLHRWKVEVWPLQRTWAVVAGHIEASTLADLTRATFFNWDAILYNLSTRELIASDLYFESVRCRHLEANLIENPNPLGNAVRALRYAYRWNANLGPKLADHVARQVQDHGWRKIVDTESASFPVHYLRGIDGDAVAAALKHWDRQDSCVIVLPLARSDQQLSLFE
ncbi:MAG TPA: hypothetical protein VG757_14045 [Devosia sp.]|nr:hypothetical protein [Devosia sp.]